MMKYIRKSDLSILEEGWDDFRGIISKDGLPRGHSFKKPAKNKTIPCYALYRKMQILMDGTIQACSCRVEPELWLENIKNFTTIEEATHSPKYDQLRHNWENGGIMPNCCQECSHYEPYTNLIADYAPYKLTKLILTKIKSKIDTIKRRHHST